MSYGLPSGVRTYGQLGGYRGGIEVKRILLGHERTHTEP